MYQLRGASPVYCSNNMAISFLSDDATQRYRACLAKNGEYGVYDTLACKVVLKTINHRGHGPEGRNLAIEMAAVLTTVLKKGADHVTGFGPKERYEVKRLKCLMGNAIYLVISDTHPQHLCFYDFGTVTVRADDEAALNVGEQLLRKTARYLNNHPIDWKRLRSRRAAERTTAH